MSNHISQSFQKICFMRRHKKKRKSRVKSGYKLGKFALKDKLRVHIRLGKYISDIFDAQRGKMGACKETHLNGLCLLYDWGEL